MANSKTPATDMNIAAEVTPLNFLRTHQIRQTLKLAYEKSQLPMFHEGDVYANAYDAIIEAIPPLGSA
jgi:hypothetical protein